MVVAVLSIFAVTSCGGEDDGNGGSTTQDAIDKSIAAFQDIESDVEDNFGDVCVLKAQWNCNAACEVGSLDYDDVTETAILNSCEHTDGSTFTGTIQYNDALGTMDLDLSLFGDCTFVKGTITGADVDNCDGIVTAKCNGEDITCEMESSCETCTITSDGGGGGTTGAPALSAALAEFLTKVAAGDYLMDILTYCTGSSPIYTDCPCPDSGTFDWDFLAEERVYESCSATSGLVFTGTVQEPTLGSFDFDLMSQFGLCTSVTGYVTLDDTTSMLTCTEGTLSGICPSATPPGTETVTCTVASDCTCS
jgi:hypothetical protein